VTDTRQLLDVLTRTPGIVLAVLFGSAARGPVPGARDIDVGVLFDVEPAGIAQTTSLQVALERATRLPVDLVVLATAPPLLRFEIARDGVLLVERVPYAWYDYRVRAVRDWWDWAPTARRMYAAAAQRNAEAASRSAASAAVPATAPGRPNTSRGEVHDGPA
jgi:predicted nucleotidyltransferase